MSKQRSLSRKMLTQFAACMALLFVLATPLFYLLTERYYAEDMIDIIEAVGSGRPIPSLDLEEDIMHGVMIQYGVIVAVLSVAVALTVRFLSRRLWHPFYETLRRAEGFRLEDGTLPDLPPSDVAEFTRLNNTLSTLMANGLASYRTQKEFTENASHELQTPIAVMRSTLDLMLQQPGLTPRLAGMIQSLYGVTGRLARLNRSLLLLAKIENNQYDSREDTDVVALVRYLLPQLEGVAGSVALRDGMGDGMLAVSANRALLEVLVSNLLVNAVRHNRPGCTVGHTPAGTSGRNTARQVADSLNTTGIYSVVRHPLYLGNFLMWLGVSLLTCSPGFVAAFALAYWIYYERIMYAEEQFLRRKFGTAYALWAASTPAFLPRLGQYVPLALPFSWRKVLKKEKNGAFALLLTFAAFDVLGAWLGGSGSVNIPLAAAAAASGVAYVALTVMKHHTRWLDEEGR